MSKKLVWICLIVLIIGLGAIAWLTFVDTQEEPEEQAPSGIIREETLDIQTENPQPAGRNIQPTE